MKVMSKEKNRIEKIANKIAKSASRNLKKSLLDIKLYRSELLRNEREVIRYNDVIRVGDFMDIIVYKDKFFDEFYVIQFGINVVYEADSILDCGKIVGILLAKFYEGANYAKSKTSNHLGNIGNWKNQI